MDQYVLRIRGLCGAGKTTLARRLQPLLGARIFEIGSYRRRYREELDSWDLMMKDIDTHINQGGRAIVPTTGLNANEYRLDLMPNAPLTWLDADLQTLDTRVRSKPFWERGYLNFLGLPIYQELGTKFKFNRKFENLYRDRQTRGLRLDALDSPENLCLSVLNYLKSLDFTYPVDPEERR